MSEFIKNFSVRQMWRISSTYKYFVPLIGIVNTTLYAIIAIGVTNIVDLTVLNVLIGLLVLFALFNIIGFLLDKFSVFSKDYEKLFGTQIKPIYLEQSDYNAILMAYYSKFSKEELEEILSKHTFRK